jgi:hypothetical protein
MVNLSIPGMIGTLVMSLYNIVDTFWVSGLPTGTHAVAALTVLFPLQMIVGAVGGGMSAGVTSLVARRLGGITRSGDLFTVKLLQRVRDGWAGRDAAEQLPEKLAFVLGWLCHRAADRQMKPLFRRLDGDCPLKPTDCSVYHDVFLFREAYASGAVEPYAQDALAPSLGVDHLEALLRTIWQRALTSMHTFIPDADDIERWLERVFATRQRFTVDIRR